MSEEGYGVRMGTVGDARVIAAHRRLMFQAMGTLPEGQEHALEAASLRYLDAALPSGEYLAWLAEHGGVVVGGAGVVLRRLLPRPGHLDGGQEAYVINVWVDEEHRGRGLASRLMRELIGWCREQGVRRVALHASDEGRRVYERLGFGATNEMRLDLGR